MRNETHHLFDATHEQKEHNCIRLVNTDMGNPNMFFLTH